ncbi:mitochondrial processing peptidase alpha subunit [Heterostelium album PN500]|uniref:Mitochondrial processing peptidase alpha subunit n=1 Tax=Heterostelium pallidum (strain ATCC 26659 / Pp 5 / PN500) TaxID=670386 RepID=D3B2S7_HETP5|nr:mitochondrial processing peptidase alpha subunit [Heterostelium album PN500]EFA83625.1 mitochondrial processing peptidase alpha subunit [Heterostelium album PN500]|eukprot:XP_020435742.1 mitochondrial processing peptidase alpha subunit [Heterostelium album PN500]
MKYSDKSRFRYRSLQNVASPLFNRFHYNSSKSFFQSPKDDLKVQNDLHVVSSGNNNSSVNITSAAAHQQIKQQPSPFTSLNTPHPKLNQFLQKSIPTPNITTSTSSTTSQQQQQHTPFNTAANFNRADISTLPNGIKVISQQTNQNACAIGLYVRGGSAFETEKNRGVFKLLEKMTFKGTKNESTADIVKKYETISLNAQSATSNDSIQFSVEVLRKDVEYILKSFADQITCPNFDGEEFEEVKMDAIRTFSHFLNYPEDLLPLLMQNVAFGNTGFGQSPHAQPQEYEALTVEHLRETLKNHYIGKNIVISATGIDHRQLVNYVERYYGDIPYSAPSPGVAAAASSLVNTDRVPYYGGSHLISDVEDAEQAYYYLAFPCRGFKSVGESKDVYAGFVLQTLLGGGRDFSVGGPGKGMQSRLNLHVVYALQHVRECSAFLNLEAGIGLFGIRLATSTGFLKNGISLMLNQLLSLRRLITDEEIERAKRQQKSLILMNLELRGVLCDDMAKQLLTTGVWRTPDEICRGIDSVTKEDILRFLDQLLLTEPTIVAIYDGSQDTALSGTDLKKIIKSGQY